MQAAQADPRQAARRLMQNMALCRAPVRAPLRALDQALARAPPQPAKQPAAAAGLLQPRAAAAGVGAAGVLARIAASRAPVAQHARAPAAAAAESAGMVAGSAAGPHPARPAPAANAPAPPAAPAAQPPAARDASADTTPDRCRKRQEARADDSNRRKHAAQFGYDWELGLLGDDGKRRAYGMCSDPLSLQRACDATLAAIPAVTGADAKKLAEDGAYAIDNPLKKAALLHKAVVQLVKVLPIGTVIKSAGIRDEDLASVDAGRVLGFLLRRVQSRWRYSTIDNARRAWTRLELWLRDEGVQHENGDVDVLTLNEYFLFCHNDSAERSNRAWTSKLQRWDADKAKAAKQGGAVPTKPIRARFGNKGALGQYDGLSFLTDNFGMGMPTAGRRKELPELAGHRAQHMPKPAPPLPLWAIAKIEQYATADSTPPAMRNAAAATLFLVYGCCRAEQAQNMQVYGIAHDCIWGQVNVEKGKTKRPRPFWAALHGFFGRGWWDVLVETLENVSDGGFVFRDYSGDPLSQHAKPDPACLDEEAITPRIRLVLQQACGMSKEEAATYTKHSCRHCLPASAAARGEGFQRQVEVGRWAGGTFDASDLFGDDFLRAKHAMRASDMPIRYTARLRPRRLASIMAQQTAAFRRLLADHGGRVDALPRDPAGYGMLPKYDPVLEGL
eukprot:Tamp_01638.p1 GENE.Tamp_01638~~Tamp_01638.p1  ORF type:complete len:673 (-),score=112.81 Tamp_01638:2325-4343(-)